MRFVFRPLSLLLSAILVVGLPFQAQENHLTGPDNIQELHLRVLEGRQPEVEPGKPSNKPLVLAVTGLHDEPVPSATVLVRLPADGPTGVFSDGSRVAVLYTDMTGQASINHILWGSTTGTAAVRITASKGSAHTGILFEQVVGSSSAKAAPAAPAVVAVQPGQPRAQQAQDPVLVASAAPAAAASPSEPPSVVINNHPDRQTTGAASGHSGKKWIWIGVGVAAAAGAAVAFAGKGGGSSPSTSSSTVTTVGNPSVSIGHP